MTVYMPVENLDIQCDQIQFTPGGAGSYLITFFCSGKPVMTQTIGAVLEGDSIVLEGFEFPIGLEAGVES